MKKIFVNGTFDILHPGHIALLNFAKSLGGHLTVAIDSDDRVRSLKGSTRPINTQNERKYMLQNIKAVDAVVIFENDYQLTELVSACDVMVKGSDYKGKRIIGESVCPEIVFFDIDDDYSTTKKIQSIIDRR
jgi:rfaE bifunctional protein nucleotidyltransferase chain/domain